MKKIYFFSMYFIFVLVYLNEFFNLNQNNFAILVSVGICFLLVSSLTMTRGFQLYVSIISLTLGHIILFKYNLGFNVWYSSLIKSIGIPVLFVVIPMISFPIKHGQYLKSVEDYVASKSEKPIFLFALLAITHLSLTIPLNIGSIPTMQKLLEKIKFPKEYLAHLYTAGYSSYMVFSPYDGVVNMVLLFTSLTYSEYFLSGLSMVILIIMVSAFFLKIDNKLLQQLNNTLSSIRSSGNDKKMYELLFHIFVLIFLAFLGESFIPFSNQLYIIAVIIIIYSTFWGFFLNALDKYRDELKKYCKNLLDFKSFIPFLISTGFLGSMISFTPLKDNIGSILLSLNSLPLYFIIQFFILLTIVLSLCGVHMMITVTTLALTITPEFIGLSNVAFALTLLTCWYIAMSISPFVPFTIIVADTIKEKPLNVTFKYNLKFSFIMLFIAPIIILLINYF
ncbi:MAG: hypothetical protein PWQ67_2238 [Clostridia bacterium]|nr:hypothetical protein [Clostridia bacterium]